MPARVGREAQKGRDACGGMPSVGLRERLFVVAVAVAVAVRIFLVK